MKEKAEFIVRVLLNSAVQTVCESEAVRAAKFQIRERYNELKRTLPFMESEIQAKTEWLKEILKE